MLASDAGMSVLHVTRRLQDEFTAMPGLRLTSAQAKRLCTSDAWTTASALRSLVAAGFLTVMSDGQYARTDLVAGRLASRSTLQPQAAGIAPAVRRRVACLVEFEDASRDALSPGSQAALRYATTLALTNRARVTVLHMIPPSSPQTTSHAAIAPRPGRSVAGEGLDELIDVQTVAGSSTEELLRAATETHADLIVLAAGEPSSMPHVCELVHQASCPVLIVQPARPAAVA